LAISDYIQLFIRIQKYFAEFQKFGLAQIRCPLRRYPGFSIYHDPGGV